MRLPLGTIGTRRKGNSVGDDLRAQNERNRKVRDIEAQMKWDWKMKWCKRNNVDPHIPKNWQHAEDAFLLETPGGRWIDA